MPRIFRNKKIIRHAKCNNHKTSLSKQNYGKSNLRLNLKDFRALRVHYQAQESLS